MKKINSCYNLSLAEFILQNQIMNFLQYVIRHKISFDCSVIYCICKKYKRGICGLNYSFCFPCASHIIFHLYPAQFYFKRFHRFAYAQKSFKPDFPQPFSKTCCYDFFKIFTCHASCQQKTIHRKLFILPFFAHTSFPIT